LPELEYEEKVSNEFFELYKKRYYFVIVSIYNLKNEILLIRDFNKAIGWELPGGYVNNNESIEEAINRIALNETSLNIDEFSPVAIIKNIFKYGDKKIIHSGIAFMALSRGSVKAYPKNFQAHFTNEIPQKVVYQNDKILSLVRERLRNEIHSPFKEIDSVKNFSLLYLLHRYVIKHIGNFSSRKIKRVIFNLIEGKPNSILDASCGESSIINELYEKYKPDICIGNDISWKTITLMKNKNPSVFFTNHNVLNLPYRIKFDLVIFKNTLHHIKKEHQKEVLSNLKKWQSN
jgi:ADP-ribose pyrophosphatase YjhB (NUDIX family)